MGCLVAVISCGDDDDAPGPTGGAGEAGAGAHHGGEGGTTAGTMAHGGTAGGGPAAVGGAGAGDGGEGLGGKTEGGAGANAGASANAGAANAGAAGGGGEGGGSQLDGVQLANCAAIDLSADGKTVLATRGVWQESSGWLAPPDLPGGTNQVIARALSKDGKVVFGNASSALGMEMFRWEVGSATSTGLGVLNWPLASNTDGSVSVGHSAPAVDQGAADFDLFRWTAANGFTSLDPDGDFWDDVATLHVPESGLPWFFSNAAGDGGLLGVEVAGGSNQSWSFRWSASDGVASLSHELAPDGLSSDGKVGSFHNRFQVAASPAYIKNAVTFAAIEKPDCATPQDPSESDPKCFHVHQLMTGFDAQGTTGVGIEAIGGELFVHWQAGEGSRELTAFLAEQGANLQRPNGVPHLARVSDDGHTVLGSYQADGQQPECFLVSY